MLGLALLIVIVGCFRARANVVVDTSGSSDVTAMATAVPDGPALRTLATMRVSSGHTAYSIDSLRQAAIPEFALASRPASMTVRRRATIVSGWAVDGRHTAESVFVTIDGVAVASCPIAFDRPDVAAAFRDPGRAKSGYACSVPADALKPGRHTLGLDIATRSGAFYRERSPTTLIVS